MIANFYFNHDRATRWRLLLAVALSAAVMEYRLVWASTEISRWATRYGGYWLLVLTTLLFVLALGEELRGRWPGWSRLRPHWPGLLGAVLVALFWQVHEPHDFKVLFDEHVLAGIARTMHYEREAAYPSYAHYVNGHFVTLGLGVDKRPLMYSFLVSILHDLTGYRPENSFVVNGLLGFLLLLLTYGVGVVAGGWRIGCFGQLLLAGLPLLAQNATGGGFDLLNITALSIFLLVAWNYWRQPGTGGLDLGVFTGIMLANCRYEAMLFLGVLIVLALLKWTREHRISLTLTAAMSPVLVLPPMLINQIFWSGGNGAFFQTTADNFLNIKHVPDNLAHAAFFLFLPDFHSDNSMLLSAVGLVALLLTLVWTLRRLPQFSRESGLEMPLLLTVLGVLGTTAVSMFSFWGFWDDPVVMRFSLPLYTAFTWCAMFAAARICSKRLLPNWVLGFTGLYAVAAAAPVSSEAYMTAEHPTFVAYRWARDYVLSHDQDKSILIVSRASVMFTVYGIPNVHMGIANFVPLKVADTVRLGFYRDIWVVQEYTLNQRMNAWVEYPPARLDRRLELKTIVEFPYLKDARIRISRIVGYDGTKPAGTVVLPGELKGDTATIREGLGGDYSAPTATDNLLTQRPADEPPAIPMLTQLPADPAELDSFLSHQYP
jgi:hypothetical protein